MTKQVVKKIKKLEKMVKNPRIRKKKKVKIKKKRRINLKRNQKKNPKI